MGRTYLYDVQKISDKSNVNKPKLIYNGLVILNNYIQNGLN